MKDCPNTANHTPSPAGYLDLYEWAHKMMKTHKQVKCPGCGLYKIWIYKTKKKRRLNET